jgi:hypothetical protein
MLLFQSGLATKYCAMHVRPIDSIILQSMQEVGPTVVLVDHDERAKILRRLRGRSELVKM